ncbi:F-box protein SKIP1-like isoform X2 [Olea europaea var. sylvestris]|uniref:F-box protein SKIP1-like isoform X2 n=1 Tax=Olea europaea var. sylvestris TaxID=158386 RepID=UPI000C1D7FD6|nr:F-box protein SKIP1-like isoform X2 [Olea europaea var. sylvestris]
MEGYNQDNTADSGELARDWAGLISECLRNILSRLSLEDRWLGAMLVCKAWLQECKDPTLNSVLDLETNFDSVTELPRFWTPEFESRIDNVIISVVGWSNGSLSEIRVRHCSDRSLSLVARRDGNLEAAAIGNSMPHLLQLELQFSKLMGVGLDLICEGCLDLEYIDLSGCRSVSRRAIENAKSKLKKLEIKKPNIYITRSVLRWERHDY